MHISMTVVLLQCCTVVTHCYFSKQDFGHHHLHCRYSWSLQLLCVPVPNLIYQKVYETEFVKVCVETFLIHVALTRFFQI